MNREDLEKIIKEEWERFSTNTPKDGNWLKAFELFKETEPYKNSFEEWHQKYYHKVKK